MNTTLEPYRRDPAVSFLMLLPLAVIHLSGYAKARLEAVSMVEVYIQQWQPYSFWVLCALLVLAVFWAVGRIQSLKLPWRGHIALTLAESIVWAVLLGPVLSWLRTLIDIEQLPLIIGGLVESLDVHTKLAIAAGAGLYEEIIFRVILFGGGAVILRGLLINLFNDRVARMLGLVIALFASSILFAVAHGSATDSSALETGPLVYRSLAGVAFGLLFWMRGIAVCVYTHATYDAILLLKFY